MEVFTSRGLLLLAIAVCFTLSSCSSSEEPRVEITQLEDGEAAERAAAIEEDASFDLIDGLEARLWASESLLADPVGMHVDNQGRVFVTQTRRHRQQEFDIRDVPQWMIPSITWETVEDRRDFLREELAPERSDENTWLPDHNEDGSHDWHDLTALPETIHRVEDTTDDGLADRSQVFFEGFTEEVSDVAAGVFSDGDDVYVTIAPDLWRLQDTTGDGWADTQESLVHGFSVHVGFSGHGLSNPQIGPDGRIYWAIGDFGSNVEDEEGNTWAYPNQGTIFRADPDGSNYEVYARGLRNPHEFIFDEYGNILSVDNDGDHAGEHERLVYIVDGSDSGWRTNWQFGKYDDPSNNDYKVWMDEELYKPRFEGQAAYITPPVEAYDAGPSGVAFNPGTALGEEWRGFTFVSEFVGTPPRSRVSAFRLEEDGATFELAEHREVLSGLQFTTLDFGPDGALYGADWIEGWGMNGEGHIWKLDDPEAAGTELRRETQELLAEDFSERSEDDLFDLLQHEDMRVRQNAQFELAGRGSAGADVFQAVANQTDHQLGRIHSLWGLGQMARAGEDVEDHLADYLQDEDAEVRAQAAKVLGDIQREEAAEALIALLKDESARVRFFAAEALGRIEHEEAIEPLIEMLRENDDEDAYLRHAGALALGRIGEPDPLAALAEDPSRALRIAAVVALRRMEDPGVAAFLVDEDEYIVTEAARAINDDWSIEEALPDLASVLDEERFTEEALLRRAINANLRLGTPEAADRLAAYAARPDAPEAMRVEALEVLGVWPEPSILDRVDGRHRGAVENDPELAREAIAQVVEPLLREASTPPVQVAAAQTAGRLEYEEAAPVLLELIEQDQSAEVRIAALKAVHAMEHEALADAVGTGLEDPEQRVRMATLPLITDLDATEEPVAEMLAGVVERGSVEEQQTALEVLGTLGTDGAREVLDGYLDRLLAGELAPEIQLDLLEAVEEDGDAALAERVEEYHAAKPEGDAVAEYVEALYGGDAERGQEVFLEHSAASCQRCHAIGGEGGADVGPSLDDIGEQLTREQLLEALVDPSARIAPGYGTVSLTLESGERVRGTLVEETDDELVMEVGGEEERIDRAEVAEQESEPSSMPDMEPILTRGEMRDLVEFLAELD